MGSPSPCTRVLLCAMLCVAIVEYGQDVTWALRHYGWGDFRAYYAAAIALERGVDFYDEPTMSAIWREVRPEGSSLPNYTQQYVYLPLFAAIAYPLTLLPFQVSLLVWGVINALLWPLCVWLLLCVLAVPMSSLSAGLITILAFRYEPALTNLVAGQTNIVIFLLVLVALHCLGRSRLCIAAAAIALSVLLKPNTAVLLVLFALRGPRRVVWWSCAFVVLGLSLQVLALGSASTLWFVSEIIPRFSHGTPYVYNQSINGWALRLGQTVSGMEHPPRVYGMMASLVGVLLLLYTLWRCRGPASNRASKAELSIAVVLSAIVSPITWTYHLTWLLLPIGWLMYHYERRLPGIGTAATFIGACVVVGIVDDYYVHPAFQRGAFVLVSSLKLYAVLALYALLLRARQQAGLSTHRSEVSPCGST